MKELKKLVSLMLRPFASMLLLAAVIMFGTATTAGASTGTVTWTSEADFESNASTTGTSTTRVNIDTTSSPGDVKIGAWKDFATTSTITLVTSNNKVYTTGVDRTSIGVVDGTSNALQKKIVLPARIAGVVYNSTNNKLYVGQYNDNKVIVIDCATDNFTTIMVGNGAYAAAYNSNNNKVYIANTGDQTVSIINGQDDSISATVGPVIAGAATASVDVVANKVYLTNKANSYVTIIDGSNNLTSFEIEAVPNLLGGQSPGNVGLRVDAHALGITATDKMRLSWNYDPLAPNQKIQFQVRTAQDATSLDSAQYLGPDMTADTWYDVSSASAVTASETDGTVTTYVDLGAAFASMSEIQLRLSSDGITSPVLHSVSLSYDNVITASAGPGGGISPSGSVPVEFGADQSFSIQADLGHHVDQVTVDGNSQGPITSYTFHNVTADHSIAASFAINTYTLNYLAGPNGTISGSTPQTVNYGASGTPVTAVPNTGYHFVSWSDGVVTPTRTDTKVTANLTVTANFAINTYTLNYLAGPNGTIYGPTPQTVNYGASGTPVTAVPNTGYHFVSWSDGVVTPTRIDTNVTADLTVTANFAINTYYITASAGQGGQISPSGQVQVNYGDSITFTITPNPGCAILKVTVDGTDVVSPSGSYTFSNVSASHTISVIFQPSSSASLVQSWSSVPPTYGPGGAPDASGNYFFFGWVNPSHVYRFNSSGVNDWTSSNTDSMGGLVAVDGSGNVYSHDIEGVVSKFTPANATTPVWTKVLPNHLVAAGAEGMAVDNKGYLYVCAPQAPTDPSPVYIYKIRTSDGVIVWTGTSPSVTRVTGIVVDSQGQIYVTGSTATGTVTNTIDKYDPTVGTAPIASLPLTNASGLAIDSSDNIYATTIVSSGTCKVYRLDSFGNILWSATSPTYASSLGIATDGVNVYVGRQNYLWMYDASTGALKQSISNVPKAFGDSNSWISTDGYGAVYVHSEYSSYTSHITKFNLQ